MRLFAVCVLVMSSVVTPANILRLGVMAKSGGEYTLAMAGAVLPLGTKVTLVTIDAPQQVWQGIVIRQMSESQLMAKQKTPGPYYQLAADGGAKVLPDFAIGVLGRPAVTRVRDGVTLQISRELASVRLRACSSSEGLHLTAWSGEPLKSRRLWHAYYYLGYDVERTCRPEDYQESA